MSAAELAPGSELGGYVIERQLGTGGMGAVYLASQPNLSRRVALKVLSNPRDATEFAAEARRAAQLEHPNIVGIIDYDATGGAWMSMQYIPGGDLAQLLREHRRGLEPERAARIVTQIATALDFAHAKGVVHRDIKPANVFLNTDHGAERVVVGDFGIARDLDDSTVVTETGTVSRTDAYAPPEQRAGRRVDHRADVYALGITCYELLTGHLPTMVGGRDRLPRALGLVLEKATEGMPEKRYDSCGEFAAAVTEALRATPDRRSPSWGRIATAVAALVASVGIVVAAVGWSRPPYDVAVPGATVESRRCHFTTRISAGPGHHSIVPSTGDSGRQCLLSTTDSRPAGSGGRTAAPIDGVRALQNALVRCYAQELPVADGIYSSVTGLGVLHVQSEHNIAKDGVFGPQTAGVMRWPRYRDTDGEFANCAPLDPPGGR